MGRRKQQVQARIQEADVSMDVDVVYIKLRTSDGKYINFTESEALHSNTLKQMLDSSKGYTNHLSDHNSTQSKRADHIFLQSIDSKMLINIQQWCKLYSSHQPTVYSSRLSIHSCESDSRIEDLDDQIGSRQPVETWDTKFLASFSEFDLLQLTNAANFLDIKELYSACCKFMATKWERMKVDEIRRMYNIRQDLTPDEEMQIHQANKRIGISEISDDRL